MSEIRRREIEGSPYHGSFIADDTDLHGVSFGWLRVQPPYQAGDLFDELKVLGQVTEVEHLATTTSATVVRLEVEEGSNPRLHSHGARIESAYRGAGFIIEALNGIENDNPDEWAS